MKNLARYVLSITLSVILVFSAIPSVVVHADDNQALQGAGKHPISKTPEGWYDLREVLLMFLENSFKIKRKLRLSMRNSLDWMEIFCWVRIRSIRKSSL